MLRAPAKLTLGLRVTGVRDDGFHLIDAEMVTLDLADELTVADGGSRIRVDGPFAAGVPTGSSNLIARALHLADRQAGVHLVKRIPPGGGLGGGSSDAAAILRWCGISDLDVAATLGADVPFCLVGGHATVRGIGEIVEPLRQKDCQMTLVVPPLRVPTPVVYAAWDALDGPHADGTNDLEPAALAVEPRLRYWRQRIIELSGVTPALAGSGATWWLPGDHRGALAELEPDGATVLTVRTAQT